MTLVSETTQMEAARRLTRDLRAAAATLSDQEARFLVDAFYLMQEDRKRSFNQERALGENAEPNSVIGWLAANSQLLETQIKAALDRYSSARPAGRWAKSIVGIGPVIAAGLLAHIDIAQAPTVGHIWRFAGLDPTVTWEKGQKRPWNADLRTLSWKIGESFVKVQNNDNDYYGHVYAARKEQEWANNVAGRLAGQATAMLDRKRFGSDTQAIHWYRGDYAGVRRDGDKLLLLPDDERPGIPMLPPAHIHARAKRYATKLFLSHYHWVLYESTYGTPPPKPYIIEHGGHAHFLAPPNWPVE